MESSSVVGKAAIDESKVWPSSRNVAGHEASISKLSNNRYIQILNSEGEGKRLIFLYSITLWL